MNLHNVLEAIATQLGTITGLQVHSFPPDAIYPPAAVVDYPESITYDVTYGRGVDRMTVPIVVLVGRVSDRSSREQLAAYCDGSGASSIKAVLEAGTYTAFGAIRVQSVEFDSYTWNGVDYAAALFTCDVSGSGA